MARLGDFGRDVQVQLLQQHFANVAGSLVDMLSVTISWEKDERGGGICQGAVRFWRAAIIEYLSENQLRINVNKGFEKSKSKATEKNTIFHRTGMRPGVLKLTGRLSCTELGERD
jgi:hypothetical protein